MKKMRKNTRWISFLLMMMSFSLHGIAQQKKSDTIEIKTSAVCNMCKDRIEGCLAFEKGVKSSTLNVETKVVSIVYNPTKTNPEQLRKILSKLGYDADTIPASQAAYNKLPACCKKDAPKH